jgi:hypothetical protein
MKKGIGGGIDVMHSVVVIFLAIYLFFRGLGGHSLDPTLLVILGAGLFILEISGLLM